MMKPVIRVRDLVYEEMLNDELKREHEEYLQLKEKLVLLNMQLKRGSVSLYKSGMSISEIASVFKLSEDQIKKWLTDLD